MIKGISFHSVEQFRNEINKLGFRVRTLSFFPEAQTISGFRRSLMRVSDYCNSGDHCNIRKYHQRHTEVNNISFKKFGIFFLI